MKIKFLRFVVIVSSLAFVFGCSDNDRWLEKTTSDPMVITKVVDPFAMNTTPITSAYMEEMVMLIGKNLANTKKVLVNDIELEMPSDAYVIANNLYLRIPYSAPTVIDNKIKITDIYDRTVEVPFTVMIPSMIATGMDCEYTPAGSEMIIYGDYFDLFEMTVEDGQVFFGTREATIVGTTKTSVTVIVPDNIPDDTEIRLETPLAQAICKTPYRETEYLLTDFESSLGGTSYGVTYQDTPLEPGDPEPIDGTYMKHKGYYPGGWEWQGVYYKGPVTIPDDINTNRSAYNFKFEAWAGAELTTSIVRFEFEASAPEIRVWWGNDPSFPIGKWLTVTIPAEDITGADILDVFQIAMHWGDAADMYFCIDNPRFSRK